MAIDLSRYVGREQAFVKHKFLDTYLPSLIARLFFGKSKFSEFVYVDGFAGPWQSADGQGFGDTSFGIALRHIECLQRQLKAKGHKARLRAILVEKDPSAFSKLQQVTQLFPEVEIKLLQGEIEQHVGSVCAELSSRSFCFALMDPKGFPDIRALLPIIQREGTEVLFNFMFDFANRFAGTDLIPTLEQWLSYAGDGHWRDDAESFRGEERQRLLASLAIDALRLQGGYDYAQEFTVDKIHADRCLYKLIFLTRHPKGLVVFRDSEKVALEAQAFARSSARAKRKAQKSLTPDLFADGTDAVPNDRSARWIRQNEDNAAKFIEAELRSAGGSGKSWQELWPKVLAKYSVTYAWTKRLLRELGRSGKISVQGQKQQRSLKFDGAVFIWEALDQ